MQCVAVCCSVLQCVTVCCSVMQCVALYCSELQCVAVCGSVLQCVAVCVAACCSVLQCVLVIYHYVRNACNTNKHTHTHTHTHQLQTTQQIHKDHRQVWCCFRHMRLGLFWRSVGLFRHVYVKRALQMQIYASRALLTICRALWTYTSTSNHSANIQRLSNCLVWFQIVHPGLFWRTLGLFGHLYVKRALQMQICASRALLTICRALWTICRALLTCTYVSFVANVSLCRQV